MYIKLDKLSCRGTIRRWFSFVIFASEMRQFVIRPLNAAGHITAQPMHRMVREDWSFIYLIIRLFLQ